MIYSRFDSNAFLLSLKTQTSADDLKGEPTHEQKTSEAHFTLLHISLFFIFLDLFTERGIPATSKG